ncbi:MAG: N-acetylmuramate alpha-1-phosphate uridylyltransferase MurU [Burkholderiales bacterium]
MKAMILAAGRGVRMRPLSYTTPKPLLVAGGKPLIVWHLQRLADAGFQDIIINHSHLGGQIEAALGDGKKFGVRIAYSPEQEALETAGGIAHALPLLGGGPFLVVNGDVYCELDFKTLLPRRKQMLEHPNAGSAHLVLVDNPAHHSQGDFVLAGEKLVLSGATKLTFCGIGIYQPALFARVPRGGKMQLAALLQAQIEAGQVSARHYHGVWRDVGTPARLRELDEWLNSKRDG